MAILGAARRFLGNVVAGIGGRLGIPETGISEKIAGGPTPQGESVGKVKAKSAPKPGQQGFIGPLRPIGPVRPANLPPTPPVQQFGGQPQFQPQQQDQGQQQQPQQQGGESDFDAQNRLAREKQEEAERVAQERIRRYGEVIKPIEGDVESYLSGRPDLRGLFEKELETQGVSGARSRLGGFEKDVTNLQGQLETIPTEDIQRRKETGMLTAAAERRIRSVEERPIREQLLKTQGAVSSERVGLQRMYDMVDKMLDITREQEKRGLEPITSRLESARGEFANEVDAIAQRLTGFTQARTDQLAVLKQKVANAQALTLQEQKAAQELIKQETQHLNEMEKIAARKKGSVASDKFEEIEEMKARIQEGTTLPDILKEYLARGMDADTLMKAYNDNSPYGPAKETPEQLRAMINKYDIFTGTSEERDV